MNVLKIVVVVALTATKGCTAEKHVLQAERNDSIQFVCSTNARNSCELFKYKISKVLIIRRFKIRDTKTCVVEMNNLKVFDSGEYHCITDLEYEVFYLSVKGIPSELYYDDKLWNANSENLISRGKDGQTNVHFRCHSFLLKNSHTRTTFLWKVDKKLYKIEHPASKAIDDLWESESTAEITFINGEKESEIICQIESGTEVEIISGIFGIPYSTSEVSFDDNSICRDFNILDGKTKRLTCKGNGFPYPNDILIKKKIENEEWEVVSRESTVDVVDSGTFVCEARNEDGNGTKMDAYIVSEEISYRNYDRELAFITQMLSDMYATVADLKQQVAEKQ